MNLSRFNFDTDFFQPGESDENPEEKMIALEEHEVAIAASFRQGQQSALSGVEAENAKVIEHLAGSLLAHAEATLGDLDRKWLELRGHGVQLAMAIGRKLAGSALDIHGDRDVLDTVRDAFSMADTKAAIQISLPEQGFEKLEPLIRLAAETAGRSDTISIRTDDNRPPGHCDVEWTGGGLSHNRGQVDESIGRLIGEFLQRAGHGAPATSVDTETTHCDDSQASSLQTNSISEESSDS